MHKDAFSVDDLGTGATPDKKLKAIRMSEDLLPRLAQHFCGHRITPHHIKKVPSGEFDYEYHEGSSHGQPEFTRGDVWFAFSFDPGQEGRPNDVPNISVVFHCLGCDVTVNAETQPSQDAFLERVDTETSRFDQLLAQHGGLWLKTYFKAQHGTRAFHWILRDFLPPDRFGADTILGSYRLHREQFSQLRAFWIDKITTGNADLKEGQATHLQRMARLSLAIRLVSPLCQDDQVWQQPLKQQVKRMGDEICRLKPFIDFLVKPA